VTPRESRFIRGLSTPGNGCQRPGDGLKHQLCEPGWDRRQRTRGQSHTSQSSGTGVLAGLNADCENTERHGYDASVTLDAFDPVWLGVTSTTTGQGPNPGGYTPGHDSFTIRSAGTGLTRFQTPAQWSFKPTFVNDRRSSLAVFTPRSRLKGHSYTPGHDSFKIRSAGTGLTRFQTPAQSTISVSGP